MFKKLFIILFLFSTPVYAQSTLTYGTLGLSLSSGSAGAVTGFYFATPGSYANIITWTVNSDGTPTTTLDGSVDNSNWFTLDSATTTGVRNVGFTAVKYLRISQSARTGGTVSTGYIVIGRGLYIASGSVTFPTLTLTGQLKLSDGTSAVPALSFSTDLTTGLRGGTAVAAGFFAFVNSGNIRHLYGNTEYRMGSGVSVDWSSATDPTTQAADTFLSRSGTGQITAGTTTTAPVINGTLTTSTTSACTIADTNETVLWTFTLPAGALNANGRGVRVTVFGTTAANANLKTIKGYFGATATVNTGSQAVNNNSWEFVYTVLRSGAATQVSNGHTASGTNDGSAATFRNWFTSPTETLANAVVIKMTGQNGTAAAGDICFSGAVVETIK